MPFPKAAGSKPDVGDLEDFFENGAVPLHIVGADGRILRANRAELDLLGYSAAEYIGQPIASFHADDDVIADILQRLSKGEKLESYPARLRAKDGSIKYVEITSSVQFENGKFLNTRCFSFDLSRLRQAEKKIQDNEAQLRQILDSLPAAIYTTDPEGVITYYNPAAEALAGRRPVLGEDRWCVTWRLRDEEGRPLPHDECPMAIALKEKRPVRKVEAFAERPDGQLVPFRPYPTPLFDSENKLTGAVNMLVETTDQKTREKHLDFVMRELSHRSKNLLAIIQAIATRTVKNSSTLDEFQSKYHSRIQTMARTHDLLVSNDWIGANMQQVIEMELSAFDETFVGNRVVLSGPPIHLNPSQSQNMSLAIHELATNAIKYGALKTEVGTVSVTWRGGNSEPIAFLWSEAKVLEEPGSLRKGSGTQMLKALFDKPSFAFTASGFQFSGNFR